MKVYYHKGQDWRWSPTRLDSETDMLALSYNNWDDYGYGTTLNAVLYFDSDKFMSFPLKIKLENGGFTSGELNKYRDSGWDGFFPIPEANYISVPGDIDFYQALIAKIGMEATIKVLKLVKDAGYFVNVLNDEKSILLTRQEDFSNSLLREAGARKAYEDGWMLFSQQRPNIHDFTLNLLDKKGVAEPLEFNFNSPILPYDINVLIGPNGVGKSYTLKSLVEYWLGVGSGDTKILQQSGHIPFDRSPNISKLILVSYSPFEEFPINIDEANLMDKDAYKYFGFRRVRENVDDGEAKDRIGISRNLPAMDSVQSIIKALSDDLRMGFIPSWVRKLDTIQRVISSAIDFDLIALEVLTENVAVDAFPGISIEDSLFLPINNDVCELLDSWMIKFDECINFTSGVVFLKDERKVELSSGQRLFCYMVINVVGQIRSDSLIVIDEPELFLHPTLEIEFISLLKQILKAFNSKAILATHSASIAREIPANCIHVFHQRDGALEIDHPPFETFGGDMQRISSYVFGDRSVAKPFDSWIEEKLSVYNSAQEFIDDLGGQVNEELLIKILNKGVKQ